MSTLVTKNIQVGADGTPANNFTIFQPVTPDGTLRIGNGNTGVTTGLVTLNSSGNLGLGVTPSAWNSDYKSLAVSNYAEFYGRIATPSVGVSYNAYRNSGGSWIYKTSNASARYEQDSGFHIWYNAAIGTAGAAISFTQAMTLDASGNLLLNATSLGSSLGTNIVQQYIVGNSTTRGGGVRLRSSDGSQDGAAYVADGAMYVGTVSSHPLLFQASNSERARITANGDLLVGTTSSLGSGSNTVQGCQLSPTYAWIATNDSLYVQRPNSTDGGYLKFYKGATNTGSITVAGTTTAYNTSSDYRLKENVQPMTGALAKVAALKPVTYKWKADGSTGEGFIAHELAEVVPQCVTGEKDAVDENGNPVYQGIDTSFLVATLTAALQELKADLDATKAELAALKGAA